MSTYRVGCLTCLEDIWVGEWDPENHLSIYGGELAAFSRFLAKHQSTPRGIAVGDPEHVLVFGDSASFDGFEEQK